MSETHKSEEQLHETHGHKATSLFEHGEKTEEHSGGEMERKGIPCVWSVATVVSGSV